MCPAIHKPIAFSPFGHWQKEHRGVTQANQHIP